LAVLVACRRAHSRIELFATMGCAFLSAKDAKDAKESEASNAPTLGFFALFALFASFASFADKSILSTTCDMFGETVVFARELSAVSPH